MSTPTPRNPTLAQLLRANEPKLIRSLRSGGFACCLPCRIYSGRRAGFPKRLVYIGGLLSLNRLQVVIAEHIPEPSSYLENSCVRELVYFSRDRSWFTALQYDRANSDWHAAKYFGSFERVERSRGKLLAASDAASLEQLIIQATMLGPEPGEPLVPLEEHEGRDVQLVYISPPQGT